MTIRQHGELPIDNRDDYGFGEPERDITSYIIEELTVIEPGSVENVLAELESYDRELKAAGQLAQDTPTRFEVDSMDEFSEQAREDLAKNLRSVWGRLGMRHVDEVTGERLAEINQEILEELDEFRAECLFFDTAKKTWKNLGSEPVTASRVLGQLQPPTKPGRPACGVDVVKLQEAQAYNAVTLLRSIKIDSDQLLAWGFGSPAQKHNITRLAYVIREEPCLLDLRKYLSGSGKEERPETITVEEVLEDAVVGIKVFMQNSMYERSLQGTTPSWEAIDYEQYNRAMQSAYYSLKLIDRIRKDM